MKNAIFKLIKHPLYSGSIIMIIGSNLANFLSYLYSFVIGRLLGPVGYGDLAALLSLTYLLGIGTNAVGPIIVKFISASKSDAEIKQLTQWFNNKSLLISLITFIIFLLLIPVTSRFINISNPLLIVLVGISFIFSLQTLVYRSVLQGVLKFNQILISLLIENILKVVLSALLIYFGFFVFGSLVGVLAALVTTWFITQKFISKYIANTKKTEINVKPILKYAVPVAIYSGSFVSLLSADMILVKHFFTAHQSGIYAATSNFGKIILYGTGPIASVMFPIVSKKQAKGESYLKIFYYSFILTILISIAVLFIYYSFPNTLISIMYGNMYLDGSQILLKFGIYASLLTLSSLIVNYYMSIGKTKIVLFPLFAAVLQVIGIIFYHSNLPSVIGVSIVVSTLQLIGLLCYLVYENNLNFNMFKKILSFRY